MGICFIPWVCEGVGKENCKTDLQLGGNNKSKPESLVNSSKHTHTQTHTDTAGWCRCHQVYGKMEICLAGYEPSFKIVVIACRASRGGPTEIDKFPRHSRGENT